MSSALALAASIAAMDRAELTTLAARRQVTNPGGVVDPLTFALELLRPESLTHALQSLRRTEVEALQNLHDVAEQQFAVDQLRALGLVGLEDGRPAVLQEVSEALERALATRRAGVSDARNDPQTETAQNSRGAEVDTAGWYAPALSAVRRAAAIVAVLAEQPATCGKRGSATAAAIREVAAAIHSEPDSVTHLLSVLQAANLIGIATVPGRYGREQRLLLPAGAAREWLDDPLETRWVALAAALAQTANPSLRHAIDVARGDVGEAVQAVLAREFPLLPQSQHDAARQFAAEAEQLGFTVGGVLAPPADVLLRGEEADSTETALQQVADIAARDFPEPVTGIYLQPDLSVIVPGPLVPADERALSALSEAEHWGVAVSLRITADTLRHAVARGASVEELRALLSRLSLTGIPQPLEYLLGDIERSADIEHSRGSEHSAGPERSGVSRAGQVHEVDPPPSSTRTTEPAETSEIEALVDRVSEAASAEPGAAAMSRMLELAIRDKSPVRVTAEAGGRQYVFTLMPVALTGGRLRGADEHADVQRTIPLTAIIAVEPI